MVSGKWLKWMVGGLIFVLLAGGAAIVFAGWQRQQEEALLAGLDSPDPKVRADAFYDSRYEARPEAVQRLLDTFEHEQDPTVLSKAAYAIMCTEDPRGVPLLMRRAEEGPDQEVRAEFIVYIARHEAGDDARVEWIREKLASEEPWLRIGAAAGLLYLGHAEGGSRLIALARDGDSEHRRFAMAQLCKVVQPMTEAVAWPISWPEEEDTEPGPEFWEDLDRFWQSCGHTRLLNDVLMRLFGSDRNWRQLKRLLHAREYAENLLK